MHSSGRTPAPATSLVSLPDLWPPGGAVELIAYAHSINFGAKGYRNVAGLATFQRQVAGQLGCLVRRLTMIVGSARV